MHNQPTLLDFSSDDLNYIRSLMFHHSIMFEFDYQKMITFESVRCSKEWCSSLFDEWLSKSSEDLLGLMFDVRLFVAKIQVFELDHR